MDRFRLRVCVVNTGAHLSLDISPEGGDSNNLVESVSLASGIDVPNIVLLLPSGLSVENWVQLRQKIDRSAGQSAAANAQTTLTQSGNVITVVDLFLFDKSCVKSSGPPNVDFSCFRGAIELTPVVEVKAWLGATVAECKDEEYEQTNVADRLVSLGNKRVASCKASVRAMESQCTGLMAARDEVLRAGQDVYERFVRPYDKTTRESTATLKETRVYIDMLSQVYRCHPFSLPCFSLTSTQSADDLTHTDSFESFAEPYRQTSRRSSEAGSMGNRLGPVASCGGSGGGENHSYSPLHLSFRTADGSNDNPPVASLHVVEEQNIIGMRNRVQQANQKLDSMTGRYGVAREKFPDLKKWKEQLSNSLEPMTTAVATLRERIEHMMMIMSLQNGLFKQGQSLQGVEANSSLDACHRVLNQRQGLLVAMATNDVKLYEFVRRYMDRMVHVGVEIHNYFQTIVAFNRVLRQVCSRKSLETFPLVQDHMYETLSELSYIPQQLAAVLSVLPEAVARQRFVQLHSATAISSQLARASYTEATRRLDFDEAHVRIVPDALLRLLQESSPTLPLLKVVRSDDGADTTRFNRGDTAKHVSSPEDGSAVPLFFSWDDVVLLQKELGKFGNVADVYVNMLRECLSSMRAGAEADDTRYPLSSTTAHIAGDRHLNTYTQTRNVRVPKSHAPTQPGRHSREEGPISSHKGRRASVRGGSCEEIVRHDEVGKDSQDRAQVHGIVASGLGTGARASEVQQARGQLSTLPQPSEDGQNDWETLGQSYCDIADEIVGGDSTVQEHRRPPTPRADLQDDQTGDRGSSAGPGDSYADCVPEDVQEAPETQVEDQRGHDDGESRVDGASPIMTQSMLKEAYLMNELCEEMGSFEMQGGGLPDSSINSGNKTNVDESETCEIVPLSGGPNLGFRAARGVSPRVKRVQNPSDAFAASCECAQGAVCTCASAATETKCTSGSVEKFTQTKELVETGNDSKSQALQLEVAALLERVSSMAVVAASREAELKEVRDALESSRAEVTLRDCTIALLTEQLEQRRSVVSKSATGESRSDETTDESKDTAVGLLDASSDEPPSEYGSAVSSTMLDSDCGVLVSRSEYSDVGVTTEAQTDTLATSERGVVEGTQTDTTVCANTGTQTATHTYVDICTQTNESSPQLVDFSQMKDGLSHRVGTGRDDTERSLSGSGSAYVHIGAEPQASDRTTKCELSDESSSANKYSSDGDEASSQKISAESEMMVTCTNQDRIGLRSLQYQLSVYCGFVASLAEICGVECNSGVCEPGRDARVSSGHLYKSAGAVSRYHVYAYRGNGSAEDTLDTDVRTHPYAQANVSPKAEVSQYVEQNNKCNHRRWVASTQKLCSTDQGGVNRSSNLTNKHETTISDDQAERFIDCSCGRSDCEMVSVSPPIGSEALLNCAKDLPLTEIEATIYRMSELAFAHARTLDDSEKCARQDHKISFSNLGEVSNAILKTKEGNRVLIDDVSLSGDSTLSVSRGSGGPNYADDPEFLDPNVNSGTAIGQGLCLGSPIEEMDSDTNQGECDKSAKTDDTYAAAEVGLQGEAYTSASTRSTTQTHAVGDAEMQSQVETSAQPPTPIEGSFGGPHRQLDTKISVQAFDTDCLMLFTPLTSGHWFAFNIDQPHYYLHETCVADYQLDRKTVSMFVGRAIYLQEHIASATYNPFGLAEDTKFSEVIAIEEAKGMKVRRKSSSRRTDHSRSPPKKEPKRDEMAPLTPDYAETMMLSMV